MALPETTHRPEGFIKLPTLCSCVLCTVYCVLVFYTISICDSNTTFWIFILTLGISYYDSYSVF